MNLTSPGDWMQKLRAARPARPHGARPLDALRPPREPARIDGMPGRVALIGVPTDVGASHRGVELGPAALRVANLSGRLRAAGHDVVDLGDVGLGTGGHHGERRGTTFHPRLRNRDAVLAVCSELRVRTEAALRQGRVPLILGGDHSISIGSVGAVAAQVARAGGRLGVIWLDAHSDMNTPATSPSGNIHGMSLGCLLGRGDAGLRRVCGTADALDPRDVALIGLRSVDEGEAQWLREAGMAAWWMPSLRERGVEAVVSDALRTLRRRCTHIHLSFDLDCLDPSHALGVGTRVDGGMTVREVEVVMRAVNASRMLASMDVVEVNPLRDRENTTSELAVRLAVEAMSPLPSLRPALRSSLEAPYRSARGPGITPSADV